LDKRKKTKILGECVVMENRKRIDSNMTTMDILMLISEGNPGAISVMMQILQKDKEDFGLGFINLLDLDDMNIRGEQIWVGYKDHCGENIDTFIDAIKNRDKGMIDTINKSCSKRYTAVCHGASFNR
jgi:hypothetical protein